MLQNLTPNYHFHLRIAIAILQPEKLQYYGKSI